MAFLNKVKWVLGILMVFVLIIATNLIDRNNFLRVKDSVITIYEDRLVANDLIFEMSKYIQEKQLAAATLDSSFFLEENKKLNIEIDKLRSRFQQTKLTKEEEKVFADFTKNFTALKTAEASFIKSEFENQTDMMAKILKVKENLYDLSKIQLQEGGRQMSISKKAVDAVELFTQLEIYILIFLAVLVQIIVIYTPKEK